MSEPENITRFKEQVLRALGKLYDAHPKRFFLTFEDVSGPGGPTLESTRNHLWGDEDPRVEEAVEALHWLLRHGYIDGDPQQVGVFHAGLTPSSWAVLDRPDPMDPSTSLGAKLASWTRSAASEGGKAGASALAGAAISAVGKSLGVPGF